MKIKNIIIALVVTLVGFSVQAQDTNSSDLAKQKKSKNAKYVTEVNGNCEQCQKRIQKAAYTVDGVKSAAWDIETHQLSLILNEGKSSLLDVKKAVAKVGHDTDEVKSEDKDYESLPTCCQYERK